MDKEEATALAEEICELAGDGFDESMVVEVVGVGLPVCLLYGVAIWTQLDDGHVDRDELAPDLVLVDRPDMDALLAWFEFDVDDDPAGEELQARLADA